jgi:type I restriction enzyme S subunit
MVALSEVVDILGGGTPSKKIPEYWGGGIPWASVKDFKSSKLANTQDYITPLGLEKSATNLIPANTVVVPTRMALGKVAMTAVDMAINQDLKALLVKDESLLDKRYLLRFLESKTSVIEKLGKGATVKGVTLDVLRELEIPLPPLAEQKRIAAILDKADNLRRKRKQAIKLADEFLRSVFLDMFGDPVMNPKGWEVRPISEVCSDIVDCPHSTPNYSEEPTPFPCLRSSELQDGKLDFSQAKYVDEYVYEDRIKRLRPESGDVVYCREGARLGNLAMIPDGLSPCLGQRTMLFRTNRKVLYPEIFLLLLNSPRIKDKVLNISIGAAAPRVNIKDLVAQDIYCPDIKTQKSFVDLYNKVLAKSKSSSAFEGVAKKLFSSISQKAFAGEL